MKQQVTLQVDVAAMPIEAGEDWSDKVCIVIDVLRASSTIVTLFDRGCDRVYTAATVDAAKQISMATGSLTGGERGGLPLPGFDFGNSPRELDALDLHGASAVVTTTNGTRAIEWVGSARAVLVGCFLNATACCAEAVRLALTHNCGIGIVCAGRERRLALDDLYCAGYLMRKLASLVETGDELRVGTDSAQLALWLNEHDSNAVSFLGRTASGSALAGIGLQSDIERCATVDASAIVPALCARHPACFVPSGLNTVPRDA